MPSATTGVIIVDHGSRRDESNRMLLDVVAAFARESEWSIVEPAHMELAQPDIATAYDRCVERGASQIVVFPYFLLPGRHWSEDIPRLTRAAASLHPGTQWLVTAPFGFHPGMRRVIEDRIHNCMHKAVSETGTGEPCDLCEPGEECRFEEPGR